VPIVAIVMGVGLAFWRTYWAHQKRRLQHQERLAMIERGITPPAEPPEEKRMYPVSAEHALRRGTVLLFLGVGFAVAAVVVAYTGDDRDLIWVAGAAGAIIGFLGLGNLAYYFLIRDRKAETPGYDAARLTATRLRRARRS
jgi:hypothetical protein